VTGQASRANSIGSPRLLAEGKVPDSFSRKIQIFIHYKPYEHPKPHEHLAREKGGPIGKAIPPPARFGVPGGLRVGWARFRRRAQRLACGAWAPPSRRARLRPPCWWCAHSAGGWSRSNSGTARSWGERYVPSPVPAGASVGGGLIMLACTARPWRLWGRRASWPRAAAAR
jgi:hypothetical protein